MATTNLQIEIKRLKNSALYGKKRHFNASDRKRICHTWLVYPVLILNILLGSSLFLGLKEAMWTHLPSTIALLSAILIGTSEFFNFGKESTEHSAIGNRYLMFIRECSETLAAYNDGLVQEESLRKDYRGLSKQLTEIDAVANIFPPNKKDYEEARSGVQQGEEEHTEKELS